MGQPQHFSVELPERCAKLLDRLWPHVENVRADHEPHLGPLTATFLLSMSIPIVSLPIERIERAQSRTNRIADDTALSKEVDNEIRKHLGGGQILASPFFDQLQWRYTAWPEGSLNISYGLPPEICHALNQENSLREAAELEGSKWSSALRNALSHGGVAYLDEQGLPAFGASTHYFAFVSERWKGKGESRRFVGYHVLRISLEGYRDFLRRWVDWLHQARVSEAAAVAAE